MIREQYHLELLDMVEELVYQISVDDYKSMYRIAVLSSNVANMLGNKVKPDDLIGEPPRRKQDVESELQRAMAAAKAKGLNVPG